MPLHDIPHSYESARDLFHREPTPKRGKVGEDYRYGRRTIASNTYLEERTLSAEHGSITYHMEVSVLTEQGRLNDFHQAPGQTAIKITYYALIHHSTVIVEWWPSGTVWFLPYNSHTTKQRLNKALFSTPYSVYSDRGTLTVYNYGVRVKPANLANGHLIDHHGNLDPEE